MPKSKNYYLLPLKKTNPLWSMIIRSVLSGEIDKAEKKISAGKVTNNLDAIDAMGVRKLIMVMIYLQWKKYL